MKLRPGLCSYGSGLIKCSFSFNDTSDIYKYLGEQIEPCVFRPGKVLFEELKDIFGNVIKDTCEITNVVEVFEGLEDNFIGYEFMFKCEVERMDDLFYAY